MNETLVMKNFQLLNLICCLTISATYSYSQPEPGMPSEPGKCFAKCLIQDTYDIESTSIYMEAIDDQPMYNIVSEEVETQPASQKWVKKVSKDCISSNPDDCMVWCLIETPRQVRTINRIKKINQEFYDAYLAHPNDYRVISQDKRVLSTLGGSTEWWEVLCNDAANYEVVLSQVESELTKKGYKTGSAEKMSSLTKSALVKYQKDSSLPIGNLDILTLHSLGIEGYINEAFNQEQKANSKSIRSQEKFKNITCTYGEDYERITTPDTISYTSTVYTGSKVKKLKYADYIDLSKVNSNNYNPSNPRHAVVLNSKYDKLYSMSPGDFTERENTVHYDKVIRPGGFESFDCVCPDHPDISTIQSAIELALVGKGYTVDNTFSETTKRSLTKFQLKHNRPIGVLDFETLHLLGVEY